MPWYPCYLEEELHAGHGATVIHDALLPPLGALVMSFYALHEIESKPRVGGRALAMTGTVGSLVGLVWTVSVILIMAVKGVQAL